MASDLLIRGARIIDGTGAPWFTGDVRISGGRMISIGPSLDSRSRPGRRGRAVSRARLHRRALPR